MLENLGLEGNDDAQFNGRRTVRPSRAEREAKRKGSKGAGKGSGKGDQPHHWRGGGRGSSSSRGY